MPSVPIQRLRDEIESLCLPPLGSVATWKIARQIFDGLERHAAVKKTGDLTPMAISQWLRADPKEPANTFKLLSSLRHACHYAVLKGWLKSSPFSFRKLEAWVRDHDPDNDLDEKVDKHHPLDELQRVLKAMQAEAPQGWENHRLFAMAVTTFLTGGRAKEIQASRVEDFDLVGRWLKIQPNERRRLKTKKSRRKVPLPVELVTVLGEWLPNARSEWAFPGVMRVGPWTTGASGYAPLDRLKQAGERHGLKGLTFQSLRHSYITHSAGPWRVPDLLTQRIAGHTNVETTTGYRGFDPANIHAGIASISLGLAMSLASVA